MENITTLIFDFGGVIIDLDRDACVRRYIELGIKDADALLSNYIQSGIFLQLEKGLISKETFREELRKVADLPISDEEIEDALHRFLLDVPREKLEKLLELRKKYRMLMLSNTNPIVFPVATEKHFTYDGHTLDDFFDKCYLSYQMKTCKPETHIFEKLLTEEKINPAECLFLDDGEENIEVAKGLGFQTYLVQNGEWMHLFV